MKALINLFNEKKAELPLANFSLSVFSLLFIQLSFSEYLERYTCVH